tara:strand:+ start:39016 stop:39384 length:369 start_codon:yes stop_codon:yes gene_type:complete
MKLNSRIHGAIDYAVVVFLFLSPTLFDLPEITSIFTYILGVIHLLLTTMTKFEFGVFKLIPFRIHGIIELIVSLVLIPVAFYLGNGEGDVSRNFYLVFVIVVFLTWLITDYKSSSVNPSTNR